jgi:hypothetical protein
MRRDYFTLEVATDSGKPEARVGFDGPAEGFEDRLTDDEGAPLSAGQIDVAYRLHGGEYAPDAEGVLAISDRITGDFVLECNAAVETIRELVEAAREYDGGRYRLVVTINGREALAHEKSTFLVYNRDGDLLRQHSLIPSGVEL